MITKQNGTARWDIAAGEWGFTVAGSPFVNRNPLRPLARRVNLKIRQFDTEQLRTVVVGTYGRDGLLSERRLVKLPSPQSSLEITLAEGMVKIVSWLIQ
eukprot:COSAG02_NODE_3091_length_7386_cov_7.913682_6_plen_99_part_00